MTTEIRSEVKSIFNELEHFPLQAPEGFNFAYDIIDKWAEHDRNKLAMIWLNQKGEEKRYTFHDLSRLSNQAANLLLKMGVSKGDKVFLLLPRVPEWWIFSLAMIKLGVIQCPSPTLLTPADIKYRIQFGKFKLAITNLENAEKFEDVQESCPSLTQKILVDGERDGWTSYPHAISCPPYVSRNSPRINGFKVNRNDDPMLCMFTSGTSKHPKLVLHNYAYPLGHVITAKLWHGVTPNDLHWALTDTGWAKNLWAVYFGQWFMGACLFIYDIHGKFHAEEILPILEKYEITSFCAPPTIYRMLVLADLKKYSLPELKSCTAAGEPLHTDTVRLWKLGTGLTIREGYGQTETVCLIGNYVDVETVPGSMGVAAPGWEIELHDEDGAPVPAGEDGRIAVKITPPPVGLIVQYIKNDEENEKCFHNGFYYTGDKARLDENGRFWFMGRADDIIKSSGYRIGPLEVEEVMMQHPAVREVAVIGVPDMLRGAKVKAYVILNDGYDDSDELVHILQEHVKAMTAPYKYPREIEFVKKLPKTFSGKIKRDLLRKHAETGDASYLDTDH